METKIKYVVLAVSVILSLWAFMREDVLVGLGGLVVSAFLFYTLFIKEAINEEELDLSAMIQKSRTFLEDYFKLSLSPGDNFKVYDHCPYGDRLYRIVFLYNDPDTAEKIYFPVTIDKFTGKFGEKTGTKFNKIVPIELFLSKQPGLAQQNKFTVESVKEMLEAQNDAVRDEISKIRSEQTGGGGRAE